MILVDYASIDENHPPDFAAFAKWGGRGCIVRGAFTFNGRSYEDPCVTRDRDAIAAAGLVFGSYLILGWRVPVLEQVQAFVSNLGDRRAGELPPWLDVEFPGNGIADTGLSPVEALARIETAIAALAQRYGTVGIYTSSRVWHEDLADIPSATCGRCPLWEKVPYPYKARSTPHLEARGVLGDPPAPWRNPSSPGVWLKQFQGDALGVDGFSSTVDLSEWLTYRANYGDRRDTWVTGQLGASIGDWQRARGLEADGAIGPVTFAAMT